MDDGIGQEPGGLAWNVFVLATISTLRGRDGFHVAPEIPDAVATAAIGSYLGIDADELILAVYDPTLGAAPGGGFALTNRRLSWFDAEAGEAVGSVDPTALDLRHGPTVARRVDYAGIPQVVELKGRFFPHLALGNDRELSARRLNRAGLASLAGVLSVLGRGARGAEPADLVSPAALEGARWAIGSVVRPADEVRLLDRPRYSIGEVARKAVPRVVVTPLLICACAVIYLLMVVAGLSPNDPTAEQLFDWGGNSGVTVAVEGQYWRLLTSIFLHGGALHLIFNMICLWRAGPLVERLYGSVGFAVLYLVAGLGGSIASAWWHPTVVGVGASGAIFGVIGALLAFLLLHGSAIPVAALKPLRASTLLFVFYNLAPGLLSTRIDNAAHLGGLASGFVAGLLLRRPWPVTHPAQGLARQSGFAVLLATGVVGGSLWVASEVRRSPAIVQARLKLSEPADSYNALMQAIDPNLLRFDANNDAIADLASRLNAADGKDAPARRRLDAMIQESDRLTTEVKAVTGRNPEVAEMARSFGVAFEEFALGLKSLRRALDEPGNPAHLDGPEGVHAHFKKRDAAIERLESLERAYVKRHELVQNRAK